MRTIAFLFYAVATVSPAMAQSRCPASTAQEFRIELLRLGAETVMDNGNPILRIYGDIGVNNQNIGRFYENPDLKISAGTYRGLLRYQSNHNFVQSRCGQMARQGDFLLEVSGVRAADGSARTDILFHPGDMPRHSRGCVLFGRRQFDAQRRPLPLEASNPLVKIRREFYGTDNPVSCPNKAITIIVRDPR